MPMTSRSNRQPRAGEAREARAAFLVGVVAAFEFVLAWLATSSVTMTVMAIGGVAAMAGAVLWPSIVLSASFPAAFATWRVGPAAIDLSIADVMTALGTVAALPFVPWRAPAFRRVLFVAAAYSGFVAIAVVANPSVSAAVEVGHRFVMVMGGVCIGSAVVALGKVTPALRAAVLMACVISVAAIIDTLTNNLEPAYAFDMQKNAIGTLLVTTLLCVYFGRRYLRWPGWLTTLTGLIVVGGLAAAQSRGAALALGVVFVVFLLRNAWRRETRRVWRLVPLVVLLGAGVGTAMVMSFQHEAAEHTGADYKFGSTGSRKITYTTVWHDVIVPNPMLGMGPKWFTRPGAPAGEPHNLALDELSSDGAVGLVALIALIWTCLSVCRKSRAPLAELGWYVVLARVLADLFDIFWVAGPNTLPFLMFGLAVGAVSLEEMAARQQAIAPELATAAAP